MKLNYKIVNVDSKLIADGKVDENSFEQILNGLGQLDWELISSLILVRTDVHQDRRQ